MGLLKNRVDLEWKYQGVKALGVTEEEYGDSKAGYRAHVLLRVAENAVCVALGLGSTVSETNRQKALQAIKPNLEA